MDKVIDTRYKHRVNSIITKNINLAHIDDNTRNLLYYYFTSVTPDNAKDTYIIVKKLCTKRNDGHLRQYTDYLHKLKYILIIPLIIPLVIILMFFYLNDTDKM